MKNSGQTSEDNMDSGALSSPLSFLHSGDYWYVSAYLDDRGRFGFYWIPRSDTTSSSNGLYFSNVYLNPQYFTNRGSGFAVRCLSDSPNPSPLSLILAIL